MTMLQITFLFIGFFILILVLATIFKRYQRIILWTVAICMFLGVLFSVGFGYVDVIDGDVPNLPVITSIVLIIIGSALLILAYIIHSGFISGYQNRYGDNLKPPTNVYHRMTA